MKSTAIEICVAGVSFWLTLAQSGLPIIGRYTKMQLQDVRTSPPCRAATTSPEPSCSLIKADAGQVFRISAPDIEAEIEHLLRSRYESPGDDLRTLVNARISRITIQPDS